MPGLKEMRAELFQSWRTAEADQTHNLSLNKALDALKTQTVDGQRPRI